VVESDVDDEFAEVAAIIRPIAGIVDKDKLNRNKSYMIISVTCTPFSYLE